MVTFIAVSLAALAGWLVTAPSPAQQRLAALTTSTGPRKRGQTAVEYARRLRGRLNRARTEQAARRAVVDLCTSTAAELRAGRAPAEALRYAATTLSSRYQAVLTTITTTASHGGDVAQAMRDAATRPGCRALAWLAACWQVGAESGAGLAESVERLALALRDQERCRREIAAQLAAPRATARLLAVLPVVGIVFATGLGQRPLAFLLGTPYGVLCLCAGVVIDVVGLLWVNRLARSAESP